MGDWILNNLKYIAPYLNYEEDIELLNIILMLGLSKNYLPLV